MCARTGWYSLALSIVVLTSLVAACIIVLERTYTISKYRVRYFSTLPIITGVVRYADDMSQIVAYPPSTRHLTGPFARPTMAAYNPSILDTSNTVFRVCPHTYCTLGAYPAKNNSLEEYSVVWVQHRAVQLRIPGAEDGRPFRFAGDMWCIFTRQRLPSSSAGVTQLDDTPWHRLRTHMCLARFTPAYSELRLRYAHANRIEKNWVPFTHQDRLYFSYALSPEHVVLVADLATGVCTEAYRTTTVGYDRPHATGLHVPPASTSRQTHALRGGSPAISWSDDHLIGICHRTIYTITWPHRTYEHAFYLVQRAPPFSIDCISDWFRFPAHFGDARDCIQFACGIATHTDQVLVSYGIADCTSACISIERARVARMLPRARTRPSIAQGLERIQDLKAYAPKEKHHMC